jgi:hypothetical protein
VSFESANFGWQDGLRRLGAIPPSRRRPAERVVEAILAELRRRLGGPFTTDELVALYERGTDWCFQLATMIAPSDPQAWDVPLVAGAAFARYLREASDYGGGRRVPAEAG